MEREFLEKKIAYISLDNAMKNLHTKFQVNQTINYRDNVFIVFRNYSFENDFLS